MATPIGFLAFWRFPQVPEAVASFCASASCYRHTEDVGVVAVRKSELMPTQRRVEAIVKAAAENGMGGFALAKLRTVATEQIEPLVEALRPFAAFAEKAEKFVDDRADDGGSPVMPPTKDFRLADFKRARALTEE